MRKRRNTHCELKAGKKMGNGRERRSSILNDAEKEENRCHLLCVHITLWQTRVTTDTTSEIKSCSVCSNGERTKKRDVSPCGLIVKGFPQRVTETQDSPTYCISKQKIHGMECIFRHGKWYSI